MTRLGFLYCDFQEVFMKIIHSNDAPAAVGPYSQAIDCGDYIFLSGQLGLDPKTGALAGADVGAQAKQACENIKAILSAAELGFGHVVKTTCYLADMADFAAFNEVYAAYFISLPARSCVAVKSLPKGGVCEIEVIAKK